MSKEFIYRIKFGKRYKKDLKRLKKSKIDIGSLEKAVETLARGERLPPENRDHELQGKMKGTRECHIAPDWLLRYAKDDKYLMLMLISTGDHRHVLGIE